MGKGNIKRVKKMKYNFWKNKYFTGNKKKEIIREVMQFRRDLREFKYSWDNRVKKLREFSDIKIFNCRNYWKFRLQKFVPKGLCEICLKSNADCQHHIILLKNGGTNKPHNRINICENCHCSIHDWIKPYKIDPLIVEYKERLKNL
jgi:hypothetical protein